MDSWHSVFAFPPQQLTSPDFSAAAGDAHGPPVSEAAVLACPWKKGGKDSASRTVFDSIQQERGLGEGAYGAEAASIVGFTTACALRSESTTQAAFPPC